MERVYHYTSMDAFLKLLESIKDTSDKKSFAFWATNIFFLNDPQEYVYGQKILLEVLKEIEFSKNVNYDLRLSSFFENDENELLNKLLDDIHKKNQSPYVISFSRNEDSIPMWLNYGDRGKGICLAFAEYRSKFIDKNFDTNNINDLVVDIYDSLGTYDVRYKNFDDIDNHLRQNLDYMYDYYLKKVKTIPKKNIIELKLGMLRGLTMVHAPYIKTKYFEGEREVRLSKTNYSDKKDKPYEINFRTNAKGNIIPFIKVEIPTSQLDYVRIGPLADRDLSKKVIEMMKTKYRLKFNIVDSKVQYRDY